MMLPLQEPPDSEKISSWALLQLSKKQFREIQGKVDQKSREKEKRENLILCRACKQKITSPDAKAEMDGRHVHTFRNPSNMEFTIGCFSIAVGCLNIGIPTTESTWFEGFGWRLALCVNCYTHMGWEFSRDKTRFHGLILDKLVESI